ncbi:16S rRNA (uracil1498-N3)-methyltransferase [Jatrophihabitans sp. GAS493]|uniref:16S rRNA (uracil(1498)-N(3))-methyltransferase n=1 Tax=Jatrophihabitans sp. GAS493 TaxID=1907575 RepID=UPI000BB6D245|nr:16S rRNA (uracil(1498)-N(3))-methyltransferase [Jatrophihabitans sp. GAS493]SOD74710.1 16S rRNA (uracil1498-N3)-methyltransferase [Jatrophihabitans sp. GAS493]
MTPPLFLLPELPPGVAVGALLTLSGDEGRHAARVKRMTAGEAVLVGDGRGLVVECEVQRVGSDEVVLSVLAVRVHPAASPRLVVIQALPKGERAELAVEVMTELGVDEIVPWSASRSIVQWHGARGEKALQRWRSTAREAAKQSRRSFIPSVSALASTAAVAGRLRAATTALILHEDASVGISAAPLSTAGDVLLVVGPEGGISPDELAAFADAGASAIRLGSEVLRTSTAGAAALAALSLRLKRW